MKTKSILYWCACGVLTLVPFTGQASDLDVSASNSNTILFRNHRAVVVHATATPLSEIVLPISVRQHMTTNASSRHHGRARHHSSSEYSQYTQRKHSSRILVRQRLRCMQVRYDTFNLRKHHQRCSSQLFRRGMLARPRIRL